ncbi:hypothetical protein HPP92_027305 [Vanilla planifolia]|uniref:Uncharacterized protein n=1 Tax=Vanilla planifolia TaxID=51239 RepID=A0A835U4S7_VANPL|nr:hypothetical protein HPP92_027305 [Vanilla planifolia]
MKEGEKEETKDLSKRDPKLVEGQLVFLGGRLLGASAATQRRDKHRPLLG